MTNINHSFSSENTDEPLSDKKPAKTVENGQANLEDRASQLLNSKQFLEIIRSVPDEARETLIGYALEYLIMWPDGENFIRYFEELIPHAGELLHRSDHYKFDDSRINVLEKLLAEKFGISVVRTDAEREMIYQECRNRFLTNGYSLHGFNGAFEDSIKTNGLDPQTRLWDWNEVDAIQTIIKKAHAGPAFGWVDLNCRDRTSLGDHPANIYQYAASSPEWYAQLVAEGFHIPADSPYDKTAFKRKDYLAAKRNIELFCERLASRQTVELRQGEILSAITMDEKIRIMEFFEKYWCVFANDQSVPKVAMVKRSVLNMDTPVYDSYADYVKSCKRERSNYSLPMAMESVLERRSFDNQISKKIDPEDLQIVSLPSYNTLHK